MKKLTIQFDGYEIGNGMAFWGCETSKEMLIVISRGKVKCDYSGLIFGDNKKNPKSFEAKLESGDILFDYETGTRWKVVEAK